MNARARYAILLLTGLVPALALLAWGPIPQLADYHGFADSRAWGGLPHAADVLSNLGFVVVGFAGLALLRRHPGCAGPARAAYGLFFAAVAATTLGSSYYHYAPDDARLVWDRIPIALACASLLVAVLAERVRASLARALMPAAALGLLSVAHWRWTALAGAEDLRAYLVVQFLPMLVIPAVLALYPGRAGEHKPWLVLLGLYALAKAAELADHALLAATGLVSGHSLKHVLAALAAWQVLRLLQSRIQPASASPRAAKAARTPA